MGKLADPHLRLRCVHCGSTETPLWRAGPDGPKTLCNACGVRFKKGKLVLYKDSDGNLTAIKQEDTSPVHVPPAPKKPSKKANSTLANKDSSTTAGKSVRKVPSEGSIGVAAAAKKVKSRSRRTNAGQMPGRYASKTVPEGFSAQWRSPVGSPQSSPSSPSESPRFDDKRKWLLNNSSAYRMNEPSPYQFTEPLDESMFPDMACLGIDSGGDSDTVTCLPMAADPSSAEEFSFAFAELGRRDAELDLPERVEALRTLVLDRTRKVSSSYDSAVISLSCLCEQRQLRGRTVGNGHSWTIEDCKTYVRRFAREQNVGLVFDGDELADQKSAGGLGSSSSLDLGSASSGVMLSEKTAYSSAVEYFRTLMDSAELAGFAEVCMVELFAEDVVQTLKKQGFFACGKDAGSVLGRNNSISNKAITVPG